MARSLVLNPLSGSFDTISEVTIDTSIGSSPNAAGAVISADQVLTLEPADATHPGLVSTASQTFGGTKTFSNIIDSGLTADKAIYTDGSKQLASSTTTSTELGYVSGVTSSIQTQLDNKPNKSAGDINETSFSLANNQSSATDVTGLAFANGTVRAFEALVSVSIDATSDLFESFKLYGIQKSASWEMSQSSVGDSSLVTFSITSSGQVQYTSGNYSGFVSGTTKFRAITVGV